MDDLISRKVVIDGIEELKKSPWANDNRNGYEYLIPEALGTVKDLCVKDCPSAFEGMSNGNVIQAVLGLKDEQIDVGTYSVYLYPIGLVGCKPFATISRDWWNAPYKGVSE